MVYVFKRNKTKKIIAEHLTIEEAREMCAKENVKTSPYWYEFTADLDYC